MNLQLAGTRRAVIVCTSNTRPPTPALGQPIYETDTHYELFWDGDSWEQAPLDMVRMIGSGGYLAAPAGAAPFIQAGNKNNVIFDATGFATIVFPVPFPNACLAAVATVASSNINVCVFGPAAAGSMGLIAWDIVINAAFSGDQYVQYLAMGY